jgi:hypothetical protein
MRRTLAMTIIPVAMSERIVVRMVEAARRRDEFSLGDCLDGL